LYQAGQIHSNVFNRNNLFWINYSFSSNK